ncbi:MAG: Ser/Thr protein phosphatase family protein [Polyangiaceae bacterium]|jgi:predicted phosphodiesterase|nr:Ser/Thr protein phosphatase family protein [Polyangiaceae bacterium]
MKLAVISDLHLGAGDLADGFGHDDGEFLRFLTYLERNFERVILLGDIWETLQSRRLGSAREELALARAMHPEIAKRFERPQYRYVHGNHDIVAGVLGVPDELAFEADGVRLLFTHGHQNDPLVARRQWITDLGVWLGGWIRRVGLDAFYRLCAKIDEMRGGISEDGTRCAFQQWAVGEATRREFDIVVTGHTHLAARTEHGSRLFLNSGSCSEGNLSFLSLDTRRGDYAVNSRY